MLSWNIRSATKTISITLWVASDSELVIMETGKATVCVRVHKFCAWVSRRLVIPLATPGEHKMFVQHYHAELYCYGHKVQHAPVVFWEYAWGVYQMLHTLGHYACGA